MICSAVRRFILSLTALGLLAGLASLAACGGGVTASRGVADLANPLLGPEFTSWLVGPISRLATPEEIQAYLALTDDSQAREFIERFWEKRDATPGREGNPLRTAFEERAASADRMFSEAGYLGRRTDRGTIFVLYGRPSQQDYEVAPSPEEPPIELWVYDEKAPAGLDGRRPGSYRFTKRGDLTVLYVPRDTPRLRSRAGLPPAGAPPDVR